MSTDSHSVKAKVASNSPQEAPDLPDQPNTQSSSGSKVDMKALAKKVSEELDSMTREEKLERFPWMKNNPPRAVDGGTAMRILAEMEEMERKEAEAEASDEEETTSADKAS